MTVPDLFPALPDDIMQLIYDTAKLNIDEMLELRSVCKRFKEVIDNFMQCTSLRYLLLGSPDRRYPLFKYITTLPRSG